MTYVPLVTEKPLPPVAEAINHEDNKQDQEEHGAVAAAVASAVASSALTSKPRPVPLQLNSVKTDEEHNTGDVDPPAPGPIPPSKNMAEYMTPPTPGVPPLSDPHYRRQLEEVEEEGSRSNSFSPVNIDLKQVKANLLGPRAQEAAGKIKAGQTYASALIVASI